jgi:glycosyltransferase involved in cell wall biosynthesis
MEGMPFVILEAMTASKPVIASKIYGIPEVIVEGETGFMVPPRDVDSLYAAMRKVFENPGLCRRMGAAGRRRVESSFSLERMVRGVESVYEAVLSGGPLSALS